MIAAIVAIGLVSAPASYGARTVYRGAFECGSDGKPIAGARIELWQTHVRWLPEIPPNFEHQHTMRSDANGAWGFTVAGEETNWRIRVVLIGENARIQDWPWPWSWYTHTLRSQNNVPLRDFGMQSVGGYQCGLYTGVDEAAREYVHETGIRPPQGLTVVRAGAPTAGTPFTLYDEIWWPSGDKAIQGGISVVKHEFAHVFRHIFDGIREHFYEDVANYWYPRNHSASKCERTNSGFAFNEGWAEYWSGELHKDGRCPNDPNTGLIERNVAWMLQEIQNRCALTRGRMARVLATHRVHSIDEYEKALNCKPPPRPVRNIRIRRASRVTIHATERRALRTAGRKTLAGLGRSIKRLRRQTRSAIKLAKVRGKCPRRPCDARLERAVQPILLQGKLDQAHVLRKRFAFLASPKSIKRFTGLSPRRQVKLIDARRAATVRASSRAGVKTLRKVRSVAKRLGADAGSLRILSRATVLAKRGNPETLAGLAPTAPTTPPKTVGPTPAPPGGGVPSPLPLRFADWTSASGSPVTATGTLQGAPLSLSGTAVGASPQSAVDGSSPIFNRPEFSPPLATSDAITFRGDSGNSYTLDFGTTVTDPVIHLASLASTLHFPAGTQIARLSGDAGFSVAGGDVTGAVDDTPAGNDANGTVKLSGSFSSIPFTSEFSGTDGIYVQVGRR